MILFWLKWTCLVIKNEKEHFNDNVGSGYWTHAFSSGQTLYLTENKRTSISTFRMYEIHTRQNATSIHPGQTMNLDYSVMHSLSVGNEWGIQFGVAGYGRWQTTYKTGPTITGTGTLQS
jgi:hypothetical protein